MFFETVLPAGLSFERKSIRGYAHLGGKDDSIAEIQVHKERRPSLGDALSTPRFCHFLVRTFNRTMGRLALLTTG